MKGYTKRRNVKCLIQSVSKVPKEPIKLQHNVELAIDCFFCQQTCFFTTYSTKICFTVVTHIVSHQIEYMGSSPFKVQNVPPKI